MDIGTRAEEAVRGFFIRKFDWFAIHGPFYFNERAQFEVDLFYPNEGILIEIKYKGVGDAGYIRRYNGMHNGWKQIRRAGHLLTNMGFIIQTKHIILVNENRTDALSEMLLREPGDHLYRVQFTEIENWF
jgi:hypothetical protein